MCRLYLKAPKIALPRAPGVTSGQAEPLTGLIRLASLDPSIRSLHIRSTTSNLAILPAMSRDIHVAPASGVGLSLSFVIHERAKLIGGSFEIWSKPGSGTEIELNIPPTSAYARPSASRGSFFSLTLWS